MGAKNQPRFPMESGQPESLINVKILVMRQYI